MRFMNSGTEAIMVALKAARAFTGRPKIAKAEGAYHGVYDYAEVSQGSTPATWGGIDHPRSVPLVHGTPESALKDVVVFPFNDTERTLAILDEHARDLACVLIDLMPHRVGLCPADVEFVTALRKWSERHGVLLVFDEVITFRAEHSGLQARYGVTPDMTALGKIIGGGFPIGAVAGRAEVMDVLNPQSPRYVFPHSGTFTANPISMTAGMAAMLKFDQPAVARLNALTDLMPHRVGLCPADVEFVTALRKWSEHHGVLLVFDEVITFRAEHAGLQARYGVTPDMTALGKIIGGGFPIGAVDDLAQRGHV